MSVVPRLRNPDLNEGSSYGKGEGKKMSEYFLFRRVRLCSHLCLQLWLKIFSATESEDPRNKKFLWEHRVSCYFSFFCFFYLESVQRVVFLVMYFYFLPLPASFSSPFLFPLSSLYPSSFLLPFSFSILLCTPSLFSLLFNYSLWRCEV